MYPLNSRHPQKSSCTIGSSERNKRCPWIVAAASIHCTHTHMRIISDDDQQTSARAVCVVRFVSTADSRTEKLYILLTASNSCHVTVLFVHALSSRHWCLWVFQGSKRCPRIVAAQKQAAKKISSHGVWLKIYSIYEFKQCTHCISCIVRDQKHWGAWPGKVILIRDRNDEHIHQLLWCRS